MPKIIWEHEENVVTGDGSNERYVLSYRIVSGDDGTARLECSDKEEDHDAMGVRIWHDCNHRMDGANKMILRSFVDLMNESHLISLRLHAVQELVRLKIPFDHSSLRLSRSKDDLWVLMWDYQGQRHFVPTTGPESTSPSADPWGGVPGSDDITDELEVYRAMNL